MRKTIFLVILAFAMLVSHAQNIIHPKIAGPNGLMVNSYNGVLFFARTEMRTQTSQMPMQLAFYYNSSANTLNYGYGLGFSLGYEMSCTVAENGDVMVSTGDGRSDTYQRFGDQYQAPPGVFSTLTRISDYAYVLTTKEGMRYQFGSQFSITLPYVRKRVQLASTYNRTHPYVRKKVDCSPSQSGSDDEGTSPASLFIKLTAIEDRHGNRTRFTYDEDRLVKIEDAVEHTVNLTYTNGLLTRTTSTFHPGAFTYAYDGNQRLIKVVDNMGNATLYGYDKANHINAITDANGHTTRITYNASGMVSRIKTEVSDKSIRYDDDKTVFVDYEEPKSLYSYYRWDEYGRVVEKVGLCCGIQATLEYDENDNVVRQTDANGHANTYTYDEKGNMLTATDPLGNSQRYAYDEWSNLTSYQDANGNTYRFTYNDKGDLTALNGPEGLAYTVVNNDKGWPLTVTDPLNNVTRLTYNDDGTTSQVMDAVGNVTQYAYDGQGRLVSVTSPAGNSFSLAYDATGRLTNLTDPLGHRTALSHDKTGKVVRVTDAKNQVTAYTYDAMGRMVTRTDPMRGVYKVKYDGRGNVTAITDELGRTERMDYDERNKPVSKTNGAGEVTRFDHDAAGNLISVFLPNGNTLAFEYDETNQVVRVSDDTGTLIRYTLDANGNTLTETDGEGRTTSYAYDGLSRVISKTLPSGATTNYSYDANFNLLSTTDALGNATTYAYDALNRLVSLTDALNATTHLSYDAEGNLVKATDALGHATSFTYDALGQTTAITFANGRSLQYAYDEVGNLVEETDRAGRKTKMVYDALGRLLSATHSDKSSERYAYDAVGQLMTATNANANVQLTYDLAGRLTSETSGGKTTAYAYDVAAGTRTITYPGGTTVVERRNGRGLLASVTRNGAELATFDYNGAGDRSRMTYANGVVTDYTYDDNGWLAAVNANKSVMQLAMTYDAAGNMTGRTDGLDNSRSETYGYDAISQLTSFNRSDTHKSFVYDLVGNRKKATVDGNTTSYAVNNVNAYTSLTGYGATTPQYDDNGNLTNDGAHRYLYDVNNRLVALDGNSATYKYDALGRRVAKVVGGRTTRYAYAGNQMIEEYENNSLMDSYIYGEDIDETLMMMKGSNAYYYHADHLGSTRALTNNKGNVLERINYDPFGAPRFFNANGTAINASAIGNNILFTGREYDMESNNYYFRARAMHPGLGRFMQKDPLGYVDGMNDYAYVNNSVMALKDPMGKGCVAIRPLDQQILKNFPPTTGKYKHIVMEHILATRFGGFSVIYMAYMIYNKNPFDKKDNSRLGHKALWFTTPQKITLKNNTYVINNISYGDYPNNNNYNTLINDPLANSYKPMTDWNFKPIWFDDGIMKEVLSDPNNWPENYGDYSLGSHNCQDWVNDMMDKYDQLVDEKLKNGDLNKDKYNKKKEKGQKQCKQLNY
ncbi:MAG: RHS repeat protein [Prevotella sp.]|nr:RHS repeat protein [Prevotella sp.]